MRVSVDADQLAAARAIGRFSHLIGDAPKLIQTEPEIEPRDLASARDEDVEVLELFASRAAMNSKNSRSGWRAM